MLDVCGRRRRITSLVPHPVYSQICPGAEARLAEFDDGFRLTIEHSVTYQVIA